jgi:VanZ family protein
VVLRRAVLCFCAAAVLGALLEVLQLLLPHRWADPMDVFWSVLGAFVGASFAGLVSTLLLPRRSVLQLNTASRATRDRLQVNRY